MNKGQQENFRKKMLIGVLVSVGIIAAILLLFCVPVWVKGETPNFGAIYRAGNHGKIRTEKSEEWVERIEYGRVGARERIIAEPDEGYEFVHWSDGKDSRFRYDSDRSKSIDVVAIFAAKLFTVHYDTNGGGGLKDSSVARQEVYYGGETIEVEAVANYGYIFVGWSDGETTPRRKDTVQNSMEIKALFEPITHTQKYVLDGGADFIVDGKRTKEISVDVVYGDYRNLTVYLAPGYEFVSWSDGITEKDKWCNWNSGECVLYGETRKKEYTANYLARTGGGISGKSEQKGLYEEELEAVEAVADEGYCFVRWSDGLETPVRKDTIKSDFSVSAEFAKNKYDVTYTAGEGGTIQGPSEQKVVHGGYSLQVTAKPNDGFVFAHWSDGYTKATRTDWDIKSEMSVEAIFEKIPYEAGNGSSSNPYVINTYSQLAFMSKLPSENYKLGADIDLSGIEHEPIFDKNNPFTGRFDGGNHTVSNMSVCSSSVYPSLFGYIGNNAHVRNLNIANASIELLSSYGGESVYCGALAGWCDGSVTGVRVLSVTLSGENTDNCSLIIGGLAGQLNADAVKCEVESVINVTCDGYFSVGGFAGEARSATSLYYLGNKVVTDINVAYGNVGGFMAKINGKDVYISDCSVRSKNGISASESSGTGGFARDITSKEVGQITNCSVIADITARQAAGFVKQLYAENENFTVEESYYEGRVNGSEKAAGFVGNTRGNILFVKCHARGDISGRQAEGFGSLHRDNVAQKCYFEGSISTTYAGAGFAYIVVGAVLEDCYSIADIKIAETTSSNIQIGGFCFRSMSSEIKNCYTDCNIIGDVVVGSGAYVGAVFGRVGTSEITNCYGVTYADSLASDAIASTDNPDNEAGIVMLESGSAVPVDLLNGGREQAVWAMDAHGNIILL